MDDMTQNPGPSRADDNHDAETAAFLEQIAAPLRAPERTSATFETRVMAAVYEGEPRGWWRRPRSLQFTPLSALGVAAGVAVIATLASVTTTRALLSPSSEAMSPETISSGATLQTTTQGGVAGEAQSAAASSLHAGASSAAHGIARDTVHIIRFVLVDPDARHVSIAGDFNAWDKAAMPLVRSTQAGVWTVSVELPPGRYEYAFIVERNGEEHWVLDPSASVAHDEFRTESSVLMVGTGRADYGAGRSL